MVSIFSLIVWHFCVFSLRCWDQYFMKHIFTSHISYSQLYHNLVEIGNIFSTDWHTRKVTRKRYLPRSVISSAVMLHYTEVQNCCQSQILVLEIFNAVLLENRRMNIYFYPKRKYTNMSMKGFFINMSWDRAGVSPHLVWVIYPWLTIISGPLPESCRSRSWVKVKQIILLTELYCCHVHIMIGYLWCLFIVDTTIHFLSMR